MYSPPLLNKSMNSYKHSRPYLTKILHKKIFLMWNLLSSN